MTLNEAWVAFSNQVQSKVKDDAEKKGYGGSDEAKMQLMMETEAGAPHCGHALGEIKYKVSRYIAKRASEDLVKIAAWAFLIYWKEHGTTVKSSNSG